MQQTTLNNRYALEQKIGEGGMARVYRGRDLRLDRRVAIKVLHPQYASDPGFLRRFQHEAQAAAGLNHPGIVDVFDVGQDGDIQYIVMEYVDGSDLKTLLLRNGALPVDDAVQIAEQVASALDAAHHAGLVHRDIKPQNIIITPEGRAVVTDFGIAKSQLSTSVTETGVIFGTADYLSPEQARGQPATQRSDIYSLGVTLYEMLTARLPYSGESSIAVAMQHLNAEPTPPRLINPRIPPQLEAIVLRAMSKDAASRPGSARELALMLRDYRTHGEQATVVRPVLARQPIARPAPATAPIASSRAAPLPPRRQAPPPPRESRGGGFGGFVLGLLLLGGVLGLVYLFATGALDGLFSFTAAGQRPTVIAPADATATPEGPLTVVPSLSGLDREAAVRAVQEARLEPREEMPRFSDTISEGLVLDQYPLAGTSITETSVVTYALSLGGAPTEIPNVVGMDDRIARFQLEQAGFKVEVVEEPSQQIKEGFVTRTDPRPPVQPRRGSTITVYVSTGNTVRMPDVTGLSVDEARRQLEAIGLFVSYVDLQGPDKIPNFDEIAPDTVVSHEPRGGQVVERGTGVTLGVRAP